jgi:hypothetical protein
MLFSGERAVAQEQRSPSRAFADDWSEGRTRVFAAFSGQLGSVARSDVTFGYGKPNWTWIGVEVDGQSSVDMAMTRMRARLALVVADLAVGWSRVWSYRHTTLPRQTSYRALSEPQRDDASYLAMQLWLYGFIPAPHGYIDWQLDALHVYGVDDGEAVYEEQLRIVVFPPWAVAGRLGYAYQFAAKRAAIGVLAEVLWPGQRDDYIARIGPTFVWAFSPRFDVNLNVTTVVHSPDDLNVYESLWGSVRARYRVATR